MVNTQDEVAGNSVWVSRWSGFDELSLSDDTNSVNVTIGSQDRWDRAHLRRLRQSADLPGLVPVIDSDFASDGKPFAVTPVVSAPTLADRIPPSGSEWEICAAITEAAARAAHEAHIRGLFHGSLAPDQIYVIGDDVAVNGIGLGLGGNLGGEYAAWVAPEVLDGNDPTERSDVYSLGKVLEASLGGSFENVPRSTRRLIMWSSSDTPEARPPSALEFASILAEALGEERPTFNPAFIPTADVNDLASTASESVAAFVPSETSKVSGAALAGGAAAVAGGAAAIATTSFSNDDAEVEMAVDDLDESSEVPDEAVLTGDVPADVIEEEEVGVFEEATTTSEISADAEEVADDSSDFDSRGYAEDADDDDDDDELISPAAAQTVDFEERFQEEKKGNRAGILVGAILFAGLALVAFQLLRPGTEEIDTEDSDIAAPTATSAPTTTEAPDVTEAPAPTESVTTEAPAPTESVTTEAPAPTESVTTEATEEPDEPAEVEVAAPAQMVDGPISIDDAGIQLLHGIPGVEADVYVNGEALAPGFAVGTIAGPANLDPGAYDITIYAASPDAPASAADRTDDPLISKTVDVDTNPATLVAHLDPDGNPVISAFAENMETLDPAKGRLEIRHLAAAPGVVATIDGEELGSVLEPGKSVTLTLDAGDHKLETFTEDGTPVKAATITLADGELANVSIIGVAADDSIEAVVQRYIGLATAPVDDTGVPAGNSNLLAAGDDPTGLFILGALASLMALAGGLVMIKRSRRVL